MDFADVVQRELLEVASGAADEAQIGEEVALAAKAASDPERSAAPQRPFPGFGMDQEGFEKLTFGTCFASGGAWKYGYSLKPKILAVRFAGNCRRDVSYSCTFSL